MFILFLGEKQGVFFSEDGRKHYSGDDFETCLRRIIPAIETMSVVEGFGGGTKSSILDVRKMVPERMRVGIRRLDDLCRAGKETVRTLATNIPAEDLSSAILVTCGLVGSAEVAFVPQPTIWITKDTFSDRDLFQVIKNLAL